MSKPLNVQKKKLNVKNKNLNFKKTIVDRFYLSGKPEAKDGGCVEKGGGGGGGRGGKGGDGNDGAVKGELKLLAGAKVVCLFFGRKKRNVESLH
jgi:hypothetical protein